MGEEFQCGEVRVVACEVAYAKSIGSRKEKALVFDQQYSVVGIGSPLLLNVVDVFDQ